MPGVTMPDATPTRGGPLVHPDHGHDPDRAHDHDTAPVRRRARAVHVAWAVGATAVLVGLVAVRAVTAEQLDPSIPNPVQDLLTLSTSVIIESLPFIVLGIVLSVLVQVWIPESWLLRILPRNPWGRRAVISLFGMFLPVCECGNVPLARGLVRRGFTVPESMTFLIAAPTLNPVTIITTHQAFGFDAASSSRGCWAASRSRTSSAGCSASTPSR